LLGFSDLRSAGSVQRQHRIDVAGKFLVGNRSADLLRLLAKELYIDHGSD
jgi:hypothetical protein